MDSMIYNKMLHTPIYTGTPGEPPKSRPREKTNDNAFKELLEQRLKEERGLREPLILLGTTAFVVNVKNNKVVTVVNEDSLKGTVFTNIDGTVMI